MWQPWILIIPYSHYYRQVFTTPTTATMYFGIIISKPVNIFILLLNLFHNVWMLTKRKCGHTSGRTWQPTDGKNASLESHMFVVYGYQWICYKGWLLYCRSISEFNESYAFMDDIVFCNDQFSWYSWQHWLLQYPSQRQQYSEQFIILQEKLLSYMWTQGKL